MNLPNYPISLNLILVVWDCKNNTSFLFYKLFVTFFITFFYIIQKIIDNLNVINENF